MHKFITSFKNANQAVKNVMTDSRQQIKGNRLRIFSFSVFRICAILLGSSLMLVEIQKILQNLYYSLGNPNYHLPVNYLSLSFGFLIVFAALAISKIYTQIYLDSKQHHGDKNYLHQYATTFTGLVLFSYLCEMLIWALYAVLVTVINAFIEMDDPLWTSLQACLLIAFLLLAFVCWTYLQLLLPMSIIKTTDFTQTLSISFKYWKKHLMLLAAFTWRFIPYTILEYLTIDITSIYIFPYKLTAMLTLLNREDN